MNRTLRTIALIAALVAVIWWLRPHPATRHLPTPTPEPVPVAGGLLAVDLVDGATEADLAEIEALLGADLDWSHPLARSIALAVGEVPSLDDALARLAADPRVEVAEPVMTMHTFGFPNDPLYEKQWHLRAMGAPAGWSESPRGRGVIVAVIDTGVSVVEDLQGTRVLKGATFVPGTTTAADDNGHGTHVAGTIAQTTNNGKGVAGVAPEATILPVKVLSGFGSGTTVAIAAGIDYAVDQGAQVINLSLGGSYSLLIHNAIRKARAKGVIVVAAAGNSGRRGVSYPGGLKETIGVSATGPDGTLAPYSSWGKGVDLAAPGGDMRKPGGGVLQDTIDKTHGHAYQEFQGTSMAAPHVAGAAAILLSTGTCDAACVERTLLGSARGAAWDEQYGHGHLDLGAALGHVTDRGGAIRFLLGALLAGLVAQLAGAGGRFLVVSALVGGWVAGGLFLVDALPFLPDTLWVQVVASPLLAWPALLIGPTWASFPPWCSALLPGVVAFALGAFRPTRPLALGLAAGVGAHLLHAAAVGGLQPWFMPGVLGKVWLAFNAAVCVVLALALAGTEKLEQERA